MTRTDPHNDVGVGFVALTEHLRDLFQLMVRYVHERLGQMGFDDVRPAHLTIFQHLSPEGSRIGELAERCQLTNQSVGYLVDYLEQHGYVERRADPRNRRATLVCFTERGWEEMEACAQILAEIEVDLNQAFGSGRLLELGTLLTDFESCLLDIGQPHQAEPHTPAL
jgi:DNA-binding MarR family transcriptional regulator